MAEKEKKMLETEKQQIETPLSSAYRRMRRASSKSGRANSKEEKISSESSPIAADRSISSAWDFVPLGVEYNANFIQTNSFRLHHITTGAQCQRKEKRRAGEHSAFWIMKRYFGAGEGPSVI